MKKTRKTNKMRKLLTLVCCAALLMALTVGATYAYLTSTDSVTNTFTVGNVAIVLDEGEVFDLNDANVTDAQLGTHTDEGDTRVEANSYKLIPGKRYDKDPIIHVDENSEDCRLFVTVNNGLAEIEAEPTIANQMKENGWTLVKDNIYIHQDTHTAGADVTVFEEFTLTDDADVADYGSASITITAYAVQAEGFENSTAEAIWNAAFGTEG